MHTERSVAFWVAAVIGSFFVTIGQSAVSSAQGDRTAARVYRDRIRAHWSADNARFWYRNDLRDGAREFILVDAQAGTRRPAFDHDAVARALGEGARGTHLPVEQLKLGASGTEITLVGQSRHWLWNAETESLRELDAAADASSDFSPPEEPGSSRPARTGAESELTFDNRMTEDVEVFWISGDGMRHTYGKVAPGTQKHQHTFGGHRWLVVTDKQENLGEVVANDSPSTVIIDGRKLATPAVRRGRRRSADADAEGQPRSSVTSPDGKWIAFVESFNVAIKSADPRSREPEEEIALSHDGRKGLEYSQLSWSPDSKTLIAFRTQPGESKEVHLIRSSPEDGGRALLESRPYALPGDRFATHELNLFNVDRREQTKPDIAPLEHEWQRPRLRWSRDGQRFTYQQTDRGHQRFRLIEVSVADGRVRHLIDETSETFIWTAHAENRDFQTVNWLEHSDEIVYATEKSGWRHLVLMDADSGVEKNAITSGPWIVRDIEHIDEANRQIWFRASGCFDQDPYLIHYGRVDFDGSNLTWLTRDDGNHALQFSPDRRYFIDTYSRVDLPPVSQLRRASDGELICPLEQADIDDLLSSGWSCPEVFCAKGRDGATDIWGIICRPRDFDPTKKYPVIEDIYAGPHGSFVPKSFSPSQRYEALTGLGFIVVKIDGMGTANRSKAFHDVCWRNLKDAGFPDRILWMQAAAAKHPELDLSRVGIYGVSAGGQNAAAAVLFHPEFYRAAVAACGCHDNRMDKASWNEQWMGYPVGPHYSECSNIDNAHRLGGKLLLIVGEMDTNVPPESTLRFADALIKADKDFEMLVIPNAGHGLGGSYGQRRMHDFFVRHLLPEK